MLGQIDEMVSAYEGGRINRRELIASIGAIAACAAGLRGAAAAAEPTGTTFTAVGLNHIALRVADVGRSRDFYRRHLGLKVMHEREGENCFLECGDHFVALFRADKPGLDHYCYSIKNYAPGTAVKTLDAAGLKPRRVENRVYFDDPDGITVQVAAEND